MIEQIIFDKTQEVKNLPLPNLKRFKEIIKPNFNSKINIIAEIKAKSPSFGEFNANKNLIDIYSKYAKAISVLTDYKYFGGSFEFLSEVSKKTHLPILCKDFIIDKKQIDWAYESGADIILLIARILSKEKLNELYGYAKKIGLECLIEVHSAEELEKLSDIKPTIIGANSRDLDSLKIDLNSVCFILDKIEAPIKVAESGIKSRKDIDRLLYCANVFLIGEAFLKSPNPEALFLEFLNEN